MKNKKPPELKAPTRNLGVEMLRIVSTFMVIMLHTLGSTPILSSNTGNDKGTILWLFEIMSYCAVNCFAITSGYVSCKSRFKISRILYLWFQVLFIFCVMTIALGAIAPDKLDENAYGKMFFPILADLNWYYTAFFGLTFFSPFLNILMQNMTKNQHKYLMAVIFILFCIPTRIPGVSDLFGIGGGYSVIWLMAMYIIGGYIRIHGVPKAENKYKWLAGYFLSTLFVWLWFIILYDITKTTLGEAKYHKIFISYTSPFILLAAICLLEFFLATNIKRGGKVICGISSVTFGVFIFHTQDLYWIYGLKTPVNAIAKEKTIIVVLGVIAVALSAFIVCGIATFLQMKLFKLIGIDALCNFVQNKLFKKPAAMLETPKENNK
ncbi:MAG: acyltransferase [Ruminococcaceae bacterium]|nr:acyltransferase [Oscillospiraceae bacterium]